MSRKDQLYDECGEPLYFQVQWDLFYDDRLEASDIWIYSILKDYVRGLRAQAHRESKDPDAVVLYPSRKWLERRLGGRVKSRTITGSIARLQKAGWIETKHRTATTNLFILKDAKRDTSMATAATPPSNRCHTPLATAATEVRTSRKKEQTNADLASRDHSSVLENRVPHFKHIVPEIKDAWKRTTGHKGHFKKIDTGCLQHIWDYCGDYGGIEEVTKVFELAQKRRKEDKFWGEHFGLRLVSSQIGALAQQIRNGGKPEGGDSAFMERLVRNRFDAIVTYLDLYGSVPGSNSERTLRESGVVPEDRKLVEGVLSILNGGGVDLQLRFQKQPGTTLESVIHEARTGAGGGAVGSLFDDEGSGGGTHSS